MLKDNCKRRVKVLKGGLSGKFNGVLNPKFHAADLFIYLFLFI